MANHAQLRRSRVVLALLTLAFLCFTAQSVEACGATIHLFIGDTAKDKLEEGSALRNLLENNRNAFQMGLVFPDLLHGVRDTDKSDNHTLPFEKDAANYTHSPEFFTEYARAITERCKELEGTPNGQAECDRLKAHFLGVIGHIVGDVNYDNRFVTAVAQRCYGDEDEVSAKAKLMLGKYREKRGANLKKKGTDLEDKDKNDKGLDDRRGDRKQNRSKKWQASALDKTGMVAQHFTDQTVDGAAFETLPPENEYKETRKIDDPDHKLGKAVNRGQEWRDKQRAKRANRQEGTKRDDRRESAANKEERTRLWNSIHPKDAYIPADLLAVVLTEELDVGDRDRATVLEEGAVSQRKSVGWKPSPGTPRAHNALRRANIECPDAIDFDSDTGWYWGPGGVDETSDILADFMQAIWAEWEKGRTPEFRAGPCRVHDAPHMQRDKNDLDGDGDTKEKIPKEALDRGGEYVDGHRYGESTWIWLHKNVCMRVSPAFERKPGPLSSATASGTSSAKTDEGDEPVIVEHCIYPEGMPTIKRAEDTDLESQGDCGVTEIEEDDD